MAIGRYSAQFYSLRNYHAVKNCELCRLISQSIQAKTGSLENVNGYIALALSPKFLIIDGEHGFDNSRVFLRLFANAGKK
jgi:hypothetical protein